MDTKRTTPAADEPAVADDAAIADDPALARTSATGWADRSRDYGEPAPDREQDRLGQPETNTGAFAGAVTGAVLGGVGGPVGVAAGAAVGGVVGGAIGAALADGPGDSDDDAGAAGDVADVDSDHDRVKRTYSGQIYEAGSVMDTPKKDQI